MSYIGQEVRQSRATRTTFTAAGGETSLAVDYSPGQLSVYLNGVKLVDGVDFYATDGLNITGLDALSLDDTMDFVALDTFLSSDTVPASAGGVFNKRVTFQNVTDNPSTLIDDLIAPINYSTTISGPVTVPNLTVQGNLNVMTSINVSGNTNIATGGSLNIIG